MIKFLNLDNKPQKSLQDSLSVPLHSSITLAKSFYQIKDRSFDSKTPNLNRTVTIYKSCQSQSMRRIKHTTFRTTSLILSQKANDSSINSNTGMTND